MPDGKSGQSSERRNRLRLPFRADQYVAAFRGSMPRPEEFERVRCHDLSTGGFSYFANRMPDTDLIVAALGSDREPQYFVAEVRFARRVANGQVLIGCQFKNRLS